MPEWILSQRLWTFDAFTLANLILIGVLYLVGVRRLTRARTSVGHAWPIIRTVSFLGGLLLLGLAYLGPFETLAHELFSMHMASHLVVMMLAAPFLILGHPVELLIRTGPASVSSGTQRFLATRAVHALLNPVFTWLLFAGVLITTHLTPVMQWVLTEHDAMLLVERPLYLVSALLFYYPLVGSDTCPRRPRPSIRVLSLGLMMIPETVLGAIIFLAPVELYPAYADAAALLGIDPMRDQKLAGALMWALTMVIDSLWIMLAAIEWYRSEERSSAADDEANGVSLRPLVLIGEGVDADGPDVDIAFDIVIDADSRLGVPPDTNREAVRFSLASPDSPRGESLIAEDAAGRPIGLLTLEVEDGDEGGRVFCDVYTRPDVPASVADLLLTRGVTAAQRLAHGSGEWTLNAGCYLVDQAYAAALGRQGFREKRRFWRMVIDLSTAPIASVVAPPGVERVVADTDTRQRQMHAILERAFADHYGHQSHDWEEWLARYSANRDTTPDRWWLLLREGEPVAACIEDDSRAEFGSGYVRMLGVLPEARGLGLARYLLLASFAGAAQRGMSSMRLTVDSENTTGATRLYESVGMTPESVICSWERTLR